MTEYKVSARAYTKMILHAAKYPHCAVNGILLSSNAGKDKSVQIVDAVPLFHQCLHVSPMAEIALVQVCLSFIDTTLVSGRVNSSATSWLTRFLSG